MRNKQVRTTLDIADDVLNAVNERARRENKSAEEVISELARAALTASAGASEPVPGTAEELGFRPFARRGRIVTNELIDQLREDAL
jgi:hypothetical protein